MPLLLSPKQLPLPKAVIFIELFTPLLSVLLSIMRAATLLWLLTNVSPEPTEVLVHSPALQMFVHTEHVRT